MMQSWVEAVDKMRQVLQVGMPVGNDRFTEVICLQLGLQHNTGKRGRQIRLLEETNTSSTTQQNFRFRAD